MSTSILNPEDTGSGFYLNEFWGGEERRTCHQITSARGSQEWAGNGYVVLTRAEMFDLCAGFLRHVAEEVK